MTLTFLQCKCHPKGVIIPVSKFMGHTIVFDSATIISKKLPRFLSGVTRLVISIKVQ